VKVLVSFYKLTRVVVKMEPIKVYLYFQGKNEEF